jgi:hypothetical protein
MRAGPRKPIWPFTLNRDCEQAVRLVGWWPGVPGGSLKSLDMSPSCNHGVLTTFASPQTRASGWFEGKDGGKGAIVFDGADDQLAFTAEQSTAYKFAETQPFSISMWLYPGTQVGVVSFLMGIRAAPGGPDGPGWFCYYDKATSAVYWIFQGNNLFLDQRLSTASSVPVGSWTQITCTRDASNTITGTKIYINGNLDAGTTTDTGAPDNPQYLAPALFGIGRNPQATNFPYLGAIEDACIWNRELSATQVKNRYLRDRWQLRWQPSRTARLFAQGTPIQTSSRFRNIIIDQAVKSASTY